MTIPVAHLAKHSMDAKTPPHQKTITNSRKQASKLGSILQIPRGITPRQDRFIDELLITGNAMQAGRNAGFAQKSLAYTVRTLVEKPIIQHEIAKRRKILKERLNGSIEQSYRDYEAVRRRAMELNQMSAAVSAIRWRDGLFGLQSGDRKEEQTIIVVAPKAPKAPKNRTVGPKNADQPVTGNGDEPDKQDKETDYGKV